MKQKPTDQTKSRKREKNRIKRQLVMKKIKKCIDRIPDELVFLITGRGPCADEMIEAGILDLSGEGRENR